MAEENGENRATHKVSGEDLDIRQGPPRNEMERLQRLVEKHGDDLKGKTVEEVLEFLREQGRSPDQLDQRLRAGEVEADAESESGVTVQQAVSFMKEFTALCKQYGVCLVGRGVHLKPLNRDDKGGYSTKYSGGEFTTAWRSDEAEDKSEAEVEGE